MMLSLIILIVALVAMAIRDFRFRAIEGYYYLILVASIVFYTILRVPADVLVSNLLINALLLLFLIAGLWAYYKAWHGISLQELFVSKLGLGDLLFWVITAPLFAPIYFIVWMIGSFLIILILYGVVAVSGNRHLGIATIPLAGIQAILLLLLLLVNQLGFKYDLFNATQTILALFYS